MSKIDDYIRKQTIKSELERYVFTVIPILSVVLSLISVILGIYLLVKGEVLCGIIGIIAPSLEIGAIAYVSEYPYDMWDKDEITYSKIARTIILINFLLITIYVLTTAIIFF